MLVNRTWAQVDTDAAGDGKLAVAAFVNLRQATGVVARHVGGRYHLAAAFSVSESGKLSGLVPLKGWNRDSRSTITQDVVNLVHELSDDWRDTEVA